MNTFQYSINDGFLWSEVNLKGSKQYYIEGYASTVDEDKAGEIIDVTAQRDIYDQVLTENITMDIEHEEWYDDNGKLLARPKNEKIPVAKIVHAELRPKGVWVKAQINTNLRSFNELWGSIKDGFLKAFSVAFYPVQKVGGVIKHLRLVNVTLTGSPVNPNATFAASMKSAAAWLDSENLKAEMHTKLTNPADTVPLENAADTVPVKHPKMTEVKSEDKMKCKDCEKEFDSKEELDKHYAEAHKKDSDAKAEAPEHEKKESSKEEKEEHEDLKCNKAKVKAEEVDIQAEVKAMKDAHEAELKALRSEVASLKAELEKPVMKAMVEKEMPQEKPVINIVSPLNLVR